MSRLHCTTELLRIGSFAVEPTDPRFAQAGQMHRHEFVFPRTSVWIHREGQAPFLADPTVVTYYNRGEPYTRSQASARGDRCDWFAIDDAVLLELLRAHEPAAEERPQQPFPFTHGPSDPVSYGWQRLAVARAAAGAADPLELDELMLRVLARVLRLAYARRDVGPPTPPAPPERGRSRELALRVQAVLADRFAEPLSLAALARQVASSPYHLCRAFKAATGLTLHAYRMQLRLRHALERIAEPAADLAAVALDLGFASHSHFTAAFTATFGEPPSAFRRHASGRAVIAARRALAASS